MSKLVEFLYPLPELKSSPLSLLTWWEKRRPAFNLIVGGTGLLTLTLIRIFSWLPPHSWSFPLPQELMAVLVYGVMANVLYTSGFFTELVMRRFLGEGAPRPGPALMRMGLTFSVGLTLFPAGIAAIDWLVRIVRYWIW